MKPIRILMLLLLTGHFAFAQTEFGVSFNSGSFSFKGQSVAAVSFLNASTGTVNKVYANDVYGNKSGLGYGLSLNAKRILKGNFLVGLDIGYEKMNGKVAIEQVAIYNGTTNVAYNASGYRKLNLDFINLYPSFGYRIHANPVDIDLTAGIDFGFILKAEENGTITAANGTKFSGTVDRKNISTDVRPRAQVAAKFKKYGAYVGYSYGLSNYTAGMIGNSTSDATSRIWRFGLSYTFLKL
ncbi:hypothetical protein VRU48_10850 [Pedobacter sp. KR3-3]|uniref:Outer membrane protein beta-barrel domain-containing protein n=1 Tax=Pedobacter albus TaxID=3113905 RepID=A0ABU7I891_9SPHI|nr:hypothetical protein [Pedobacter sp. KR3-3]MEE1945604.1 hypothetical protein [Pedobacter sp. KR3-3]